MPADMFYRRFMEEIRALSLPTDRDFTAKPDWDINLPSFKSVFDAVVNFQHTAGYRLPSFEQFKRSYFKAITYTESRAKEYGHLEERESVVHRLWRVYGNFMLELQVYCYLKEFFEDQNKFGIVITDVIDDIKNKVDMRVIVNSIGGDNKLFNVNIYSGYNKSERDEEEERRREVEDTVTKTHGMAAISNGRDNAVDNIIPRIDIAMTRDNSQYVNGLRLFRYNFLTETAKEISRIAGHTEDLEPCRPEIF